MRTYRVNDIFYSLQGEGYNTGRAAVFVRFAGCNLRCPFCDTEFDVYREMSAEEILSAVMDCYEKPYHQPMVVLTGGEPTLQADEALVELLHTHGYKVAMESNGTRPAPKNLDWLTVSPKESHEWLKAIDHGKKPDEIKIVFDENTNPLLEVVNFVDHPATSRTLLYLQPCDTGDAERNKAIVQACVAYIKAHPQWQLSLQTHKLIGIE